ncbi:hypothetical protein C8J56DRAFT_169696 [Mycena floridula]|nr:hypothetical protein C8J56DRAFT_169696 [Mycena floridula]
MTLNISLWALFFVLVQFNPFGPTYTFFKAFILLPDNSSSRFLVHKHVRAILSSLQNPKKHPDAFPCTSHGHSLIYVLIDYTFLNFFAVLLRSLRSNLEILEVRPPKFIQGFH